MVTHKFSHMYITKNFKWSEFNSKDGAKLPEKYRINIAMLATNLQVIRGRINGPIIVKSGFRSFGHNKKIGGALNSQHLVGKAADISSSKYSPYDLEQIILNLMDKNMIAKGGVKCYWWGVHYDIRGYKITW